MVRPLVGDDRLGPEPAHQIDLLLEAPGSVLEVHPEPLELDRVPADPDAEPAIRRAARIADGFLPLQPVFGTWPETIEKIRGFVSEAGRDPAGFGIEGRLTAQTEDPDAWRQTAEMWRGLNVSHMSVGTAGGGLKGADAHIKRLRAVKEAIGR